MQLVISAFPHQKPKITTNKVMFEIMCALIPAILASIYFFRLRAVYLILNCMVIAQVTESIILKIRKKPSSSKDVSCVLTGLLLALTLPPSTKWYAASLGSIFAILVGKQLFGGLGYNIFNPALVGRAFLAAAYPKMLTTWITPFSLDVVTGATPLALRKFDHIITPTLNIFLGNISGCLGETSALCLIVGGSYLVLRKIADWRIPLSMFITLSVVSSIFYLKNPIYGSVFFHLFSGGFLLGALFMATDPVTSPVTKKGRFIFGFGCGILVMVIRYFSGLPEGVMYSILFMNALVPLINRLTIPKSFGR